MEYVLEEDFGDAEGIQRFLRQQLLRIEVYAKHSYRKDSIVGSTQVDLLLCLGGPTDHRLTLVSVSKKTVSTPHTKIIIKRKGTRAQDG